MTNNARRQNEEIGYSDRWWILAAVSLVLFLGSLDGSIVNIALPTLTEEFDTSFTAVQWVIIAYLLGITVLMVHMGRIADVVGKKRVFAPGIAIFLLGTVASGLAPSINILILCRFFESIGAAMMLSVGIAIITETWPRSRLGMAIGIASGFLSIGIVLGPAVGGFLIERFGWRSIFFVNVPFGLVALGLVLRFVPPLRPAVIRPRFDWGGAITLAVALLCATLGLTAGQIRGFVAPLPLALLTAAAVSTALFLIVEQRTAHPIVDLSLFRLPQFSVNLAASWLVFLAIAGVVLLLPFYLQFVLELKVLWVGLMMAVVPIAIGILQPMAGYLSDRIGRLPPMLFGMASLIVGYGAMATLRVDGTPLGFALRLLPVAVGLAAFYSPNSSAMMAAVPQKRLGVASGLAGMVRTNAQLAGVSVLGAFLSARLVHHGGAGTELQSAPPEIIVLALHDQFVLVAGIIGVGLLAMIGAAWRFGYTEQYAAKKGREEPGTKRPSGDQASAYQPSRSSYDSSTGS